MTVTKNQGDTIGTRIFFEDKDGNLIDPDSYEINTYDPSDNLKDGPITSGLTKEAVGTYVYYFDIAADAEIGDDWKTIAKGVKGTFTQFEAYYFEVKEL